MGFQKEIKATMGVANPGDIVEGINTHSLMQQMVTEDDKCKVGSFVRKGSSVNGCVNAAGTSGVIGIIVNDKYYNGADEGVTLPVGTPVTVAVFGVIAVTNTATAAATFQDKVYIKESDGTLVFATVTASGTAGNTDTGWNVKQGCEPGDIAFLVK